MEEQVSTFSSSILKQLGFSRGFAGKNGPYSARWTLYIGSIASYPTRLHVCRLMDGPSGDNPFVAFIEQAEFTGELAEGTGQSDWSWELGSCVALSLRGVSHLRALVDVLKE